VTSCFAVSVGLKEGAQLMMCARKRRKGKREGKGKGKGDPGGFLRCRQIIIRILMRRSARKEGRVQSNQLHACNLIRETARHDDQSCAWEVRQKEAEHDAKHRSIKGGNRRRHLL
jgi:hypothetical protein